MTKSDASPQQQVDRPKCDCCEILPRTKLMTRLRFRPKGSSPRKFPLEEYVGAAMSILRRKGFAAPDGRWLVVWFKPKKSPIKPTISNKPPAASIVLLGMHVQCFGMQRSDILCIVTTMLKSAVLPISAWRMGVPV